MKKIQLMRKKLETLLEPKRLEIMDESSKHFGHGGERARPESHFYIEVVSEKFIDLPRQDRYRMVSDAVSDVLRGATHELEIVARAPGEL